jgi:hypothetical protein
MHIDEAATELLSITVDGEEHSYEATVDMNHDGVDDTVHVNTYDGSYEYSDTDGDGVADTLTQFGADGHESGHAEFDATTGGWNSTTESFTHHRSVGAPISPPPVRCGQSRQTWLGLHVDPRLTWVGSAPRRSCPPPR